MIGRLYHIKSLQILLWGPVCSLGGGAILCWRKFPRSQNKRKRGSITWLFLLQTRRKLYHSLELSVTVFFPGLFLGTFVYSSIYASPIPNRHFLRSSVLIGNILFLFLGLFAHWLFSLCPPAQPPLPPCHLCLFTSATASLLTLVWVGGWCHYTPTTPTTSIGTVLEKTFPCRLLFGQAGFREPSRQQQCLGPGSCLHPASPAHLLELERQG